MAKSVALDIPLSLATSYGSQTTSEVCYSEYYYALVLPNTPHDLADVADERISFAEAKAIVQEVTCGDLATKESAVNEFIHAWVDKFRSVTPIDADTIPVGYFRELMRCIIIQRLEAIPGIALVTFTSSPSLHLSKEDESNEESEYIYCLIRISRELLFQLADEYDTLVPIWPQIDPGSEYWDTHDAEVVWTIEEAERELHRMFLEGQIHANEAQILPNETAAMVSRRIHAIQRIADRTIDRTPLFPLYFPYRHTAAYEYLYRHVESCQTNMPFRIVDKIRLTKTLIDGEFNLDMLRQKKFLHHHMCVHTREPTDEDDATLETLCDQWGSLTSYASSYEHCQHPIQVLYFQPIPLIRNYFGEQLALYFAFLSFYADQLVPLVVLAFAAPILELVLTSYLTISLAVWNCLYMGRLMRKWRLNEQKYARIWGMEEVKYDNSIRAEYIGAVRISPIHNLPEIYSPPSVQHMKRCQSLALLWLTIALNGAVIYGIFAAQAHVESTYDVPSLVLYSNIVIAFIINMSQTPFHAVAVWLNNWENHRTINQYDVGLTVKFAIFQTLNYFYPILFSMIAKPYLFGCNKTRMPSLDASACSTETANLLAVILLFNFVLSVREISSPLYESLVHGYRKWRSSIHYESMSERQPQNQRQQVEFPTIDHEMALEAYDGVLFDYAQIAIPFGYVALFAALAPGAAIMAFGIIICQIRVDAYKLCFSMQRPFPTASATIGGWGLYFEMVALGGVVVNAVIVSVADMLVDHAHLTTIPMNNWLGHLFSFTLLMGILYVLHLLMRLDDTTDRNTRHELKSVQKRLDHLRNLYLYQLTSTNAATQVKVERPRGDIYLNGVYRYIISGDIEDSDQVDELREELHNLEMAILRDRPNDGEPIGTLYLVVVGANILPVMDRSTKALDGFVKVKLKLNEKFISTKNKTAVKRKQRSPVWNATFQFKLVSLDTVLHLEVMDWNMVGKSESVGVATVPVSQVLLTSVDFDDATIENTCDMVAVDAPIDLADGLLESMAKDIPKFGRPVVHLSMGIKLNAHGCRHLRHFNRKLRVQAILQAMETYLVWKHDEYE
ncbi:unnamed protein product [Aphanomyces euteiches]|uniref:C2 domain-containing protein n=1 Tax=Aphanomyces euteiches TaxID=100861 RepID=A0A6G0XHE1_9STRA|nr:hypothetical protein Ae201684_004731 [Aphanomyces euteiches]KAH9073133.1 hypothetical protein Ae201684P_014950 [Aphanomyces euteiches]KAH9153105.1 hypothetical protein AeRB84_004587 [Aphanomyces euteiches]